MNRTTAIVAGGLLVGPLSWGAAPDLHPENGVYLMPKEVAGYSGEAVELQDGRFRYWFYSDVATGENVEYPLSGAYEVRGDKIRLLHDGIYRNERTLAVVQDQAVLWRDDGLRYWQSERRIHPFAVLVRTSAPPLEDPWRDRPSIKRLYDEQMVAREKREYEERFSDLPEPVRTLLRDHTTRHDPNLTAYCRAIRVIRRNPDPVLIQQLVGLLGGPRKTEASVILNEIYWLGHIPDEDPAAMKSPAARRKAVEALIDAMDQARDPSIVDNCLVMFLAAAQVPKIVLTVPETGERIWIEGCAIRWQSSPEDRLPRKNYSPEEKLRFRIAACQRWCRDTLGRLCPVRPAATELP
ncbi:MAG TPA: hypothetical protein P5204_06410 [Kiritimatiellia bacterium]|nr:hypothetical protein [Kiritimatiellia bacterium]